MKLFPWSKKENKIDKDVAFLEEPRICLSYRVANLQGIGKRARQEDSFTSANATDVSMIQKRGLFAAVADGMGGMKDGSVASEIAVTDFREAFEYLDFDSDIPLQLAEAADTINHRVFNALGGQGGSTLVATVVYQEKLYYISIGDSFLYIKRNGQLIQLNRKHTVLNDAYLDLVQDGEFNPRIVRQLDEQGALTQFLGMDKLDDKDYLIKPMPLYSGDVLLLCSDGVAGVVSEEIISDCMSEATPEKICTRLEESILLKNKKYQDNYTALVIMCDY